MRINDKDYKEMLIRFGYSEEEATEAINFRSKCEHCSFEQFKILEETRAIKRMVRLKKPRNIYVKEGEFFYLEHFKKKYVICGRFED